MDESLNSKPSTNSTRPDILLKEEANICQVPPAFACESSRIPGDRWIVNPTSYTHISFGLMVTCSFPSGSGTFCVAFMNDGNTTCVKRERVHCPVVRNKNSCNYISISSLILSTLTVFCLLPILILTNIDKAPWVHEVHVGRQYSKVFFFLSDRNDASVGRTRE
jgi:hypothetical protein